MGADRLVRAGQAATSAASDPAYLVVNVCDHHDHIGVATMYLDPLGSLGALPAPAGDDAPGRPALEPVDFTLRGIQIGCCGHGAMWTDGDAKDGTVEVLPN